MELSKAEIDAIIAASPRTTVPFNKLVLSETYQARPSDSKSRLSIAELAASIKDSGVLQNLVVIKGSRGLHEVCAGGRRLDALALLAHNADIAENHPVPVPVPVLVVPADQAMARPASRRKRSANTSSRMSGSGSRPCRRLHQPCINWSPGARLHGGRSAVR